MRDASRTIVPASRSIEYANKLVAPVPARVIDPPPRETGTDQRAPGLLRAGASRSRFPSWRPNPGSALATWVREEKRFSSTRALPDRCAARPDPRPVCCSSYRTRESPGSGSFTSAVGGQIRANLGGCGRRRGQMVWLLVLAAIVAQSLDYQWRVLPSQRHRILRARKGGLVLAALRKRRGEPHERRSSESLTAPRATSLRGKTYARLQDLGKAMPDLRKALRLRPTTRGPRGVRGRQQPPRWDAAGAIEAYSRAIALDPTIRPVRPREGNSSTTRGGWTMQPSICDARRHGRFWETTGSRRTPSLVVISARVGEAFGASDELSRVMSAGESAATGFWSNARFLCGQLAEPAFLGDLTARGGGDAGGSSGRKVLPGGREAPRLRGST